MLRCPEGATATALRTRSAAAVADVAGPTTPRPQAVPPALRVRSQRSHRAGTQKWVAGGVIRQMTHDLRPLAQGGIARSYVV